MSESKTIEVGIGFATGRKNFKKVLKAYVYNFKESGLTERENIRLNLLVAYDLRYFGTRTTDYTNINKEVLGLIDESSFIGSTAISKEVDHLTGRNVINREEAKLIFGSGYAGKRNTVLYAAIKNKLDYLLFLDDDEYPLAVTNTRSIAIWGGQHVLSKHLEYIKDADITHGHHCGYISPIPYIDFNNTLTENDFRMFIEAISNDIVKWDKIRSIMQNGGVTYADTNILISNSAYPVEEINHTKFISGANLCINLRNPHRVKPFYNPPGARGEDTFLSTCLGEHRVLRVPCYTFHDGFSTYHHLMDGVLPINLKYIKADSDQIIERFYRACIGWIRYKPLLIYITDREHYDERIREIRMKLNATLPKISLYFGMDAFKNVSLELEHYHKNVTKHYQQFLETQKIWAKICDFLQNENR